MAIDDKHPEFLAKLGEWEQMRDTYAGERAVKEKRIKYLPPSEAMIQDAWSERFRYETTEAAETQRSVVLDFLARSSWPRVLGNLRERLAEPLGRAMRVLGRDDAPPAVAATRRRAGDVVFGGIVAVLVAYGAYQALHYIATSPGVGLGRCRTASRSGRRRSAASSSCWSSRPSSGSRSACGSA